MGDSKDNQSSSPPQGGGGWSTDGLGYLQDKVAKNRVYVVYPFGKDHDRSEDIARSPEARLAEAVGLAEAIDIDLVGSQLIPLRKIRPSHYIGSGHEDSLRQLAKDEELDLIIFDCELSPIQQRNLERDLDCKVIDRTALILEIFGARASTKEGELQVELAHLSYQKSRLVRSWTHLERQRGGAGFLGGPGESQIELDRRIITDRITRLKKQLDQVTRTRKLHRDRREKAPYPVVALVGYTNAGKSTLFNSLTNATVMAEDMLFATLDPTMRSIDLPSGRKIILSDTVGFVSELPTTLVAAFRATLEEVRAADIIIHVRDISHPDSDVQKNDVIEVLKELDLDIENDKKIDVVEALNKVDLLSPEDVEIQANIADRFENRFLLSGLTGAGSDALIDYVDLLMSRQNIEVTEFVAYADGKTQAWLNAHATILAQDPKERGMDFTFTVDPVEWEKFKKSR